MLLGESSLPRQLYFSFIGTTYSCVYVLPCFQLPTGVVVLGEGSLPRQLFMNLVWLVGTYLFAAVLGVITGDIMERIQVGVNRQGFRVWAAPIT